MPDRYPHPYQYELDTLQYLDSQLQAKNEELYKPLARYASVIGSYDSMPCGTDTSGVWSDLVYLVRHAFGSIHQRN
jgi:hypothetical protein